MNLEFKDGVVKVRCLSKAYYRNQMRAKNSIIYFYEEDMDKGTYRVGVNKGRPKPPMPKWAEVVPHDTPLTIPSSQEELTTLSQISSKGTPAQQAAAEKVKDEQEKLDADRAAFEAEKKAFEEAKSGVAETDKPAFPSEPEEEKKPKYRGKTQKKK